MNLPPPTHSIILLAYNDAPSLKTLVPDVHQVLELLSIQFELIVVDDGSLDETNSLMKSFENQFKYLQWIKHEKNKGVGAGFKSGFQHSKGTIIAYMDGDSQYVPEDLPKLFHELHKADAVSG